MQINKTDSTETIRCPFCLDFTTESYTIQQSVEQQFCKPCAAALSWGMSEEKAGQIECSIVQQDDMSYRIKIHTATEDAKERLTQLIEQYGLEDAQ